VNPVTPGRISAETQMPISGTENKSFFSLVWNHYLSETSCSYSVSFPYKCQS